jgi:hypothetical protein
MHEVHSSTARSEPLTLLFPTLPLNEDFALWLSDPNISAMTLTPHNDHPPSSLSESWALLSSSDTTSEDDTRSELTDVASIAGTNGLDDVSSIDDQETSSEADSKDMTEDGSESEDISPFGHSSRPVAAEQVEESSHTVTGGYSIGSEAIEFEEPERWPDAEQVELKHTIRIFDEEEASEISTHMFPESSSQLHLVATVRQTMTKGSLQLEKPFRVLYAGNPEARHIILDKIGDALVAGTESNFEARPGDSSRYHVVPTSFGTGDMPNFAELLPIHVQLVVDECTTASSVKIEKHSDMITLSFKNRPPCHSRLVSPDTTYQLESATPWVLPDIAILFMSDKDDLIARRTRRFVYAFAKRHGIPAMVVSEEPLWGRPSESISLDHKSLHLCLESRGSADRESRVLKRLPIDLKTFESVTPGQINRNLACLTGLHSGKMAELPNSTPLASKELGLKPSQDIEKSPRNTFGLAESIESLRRESRLGIRSLLPLGVVVFCGLLYAFTSLGLPLILHNSSGLSQRMDMSNHSSVLPTSTGLAPTTFVPAKSGQQLGTVVPNSIATGNPQVELAGILINPKMLQINNSDLFEIQVLGDCHLVLKPPRRIVAAKKAPKFSVEVTRENETIKHEISKLFDGVYTVRLDREDAYGSVNISIRTRTKPIISQVTEVDFGNPWLKFGWKKAAQIASEQFRKDLSSAQISLGIAYGRLRTDLQEVTAHASKKATIIRKEAWVMGEMSRKIAAKQADVVLAKSRELSLIAAERGMVASKQLSHQMQVASKALSLQGRALGNDLALFAGESWNVALRQTAKLRDAASTVDLSRLRNKLQDAGGSKPLSKAQERARQLWKHSAPQGVPETPIKKTHKKVHKKTRKGKCGERCNR